ncbi:hypothetical protein MASR2M69_06490 [Bacteroidota bacterium]
MFAGGVLSLAFIDKVEESFNPKRHLEYCKRAITGGIVIRNFVANYLKALGGTFTVDNSKMVEEFRKFTLRR